MKTAISWKKIGLFVLIAFFSVSVVAQETALKEAEAAYAGSDYATAVAKYEALLKEFGASPEVYYNLGNAYYKEGKVALSILNYERALLLEPGNTDIRFNLQMARQQSVDRIEPIGSFFLVEWFEAVQNLAGADSWAHLAVICFILLIFSLILFFFSRWVRLKKIGFYVGLLLVVMVVLANIFAANQKRKLTDRSGAIVFSPTVTVKSSPADSGTDLFILHEGTKVTIKSSLGEWNEIELEDGSVGWMPKASMEII